MFLNENLKCQNSSTAKTLNEIKVQEALQFQAKDLKYWKKELERGIDRLGEERKKLLQCLAIIERNHNHIRCLLDTVKQCKELRRNRSGQRLGLVGDTTDKALSEESSLLLSCCQSYICLGRDVGNLMRDLKSAEMSLMEDLQNKLSSIGVSLDCQSTKSISPRNDPNENVLPQTTSSIEKDNTTVAWRENVLSRLEKSNQVIRRSEDFRAQVKGKCEANCAQIMNSWTNVTVKVELDRIESRSEREKAIQFLNTVCLDLSMTRERMSMLRGEIEKQRRHLEAVVRRFGEFQMKPESERISDDPLIEMKKQCENSKSILESLELSRANCKDQEIKLANFEKELRRCIERSSKSLFLHQNEVKGKHRRVQPLSSPKHH